jgi:hypothetical protein
MIFWPQSVSPESAFDAWRALPLPTPSADLIHQSRHLRQRSNHAERGSSQCARINMAPRSARGRLDTINVLNLSPKPMALLDLTDDAWKDVDAQIMGLFERSMRRIRGSVADVHDTLLIWSVSHDRTRNRHCGVVRMLIRMFSTTEQTRGAPMMPRWRAKPVITVLPGQVVVRAGTVIRDADVKPWRG